jgi:protein-S-isoprenylcysteine O-methyltransferase Ste14
VARRIFALARAAVFAALFVSLWTYFVPLWIVGAHAFDAPRPLGWIVVAIGAAIDLQCFWQFAWRGLGTPAPFDPPRHLVVSGPYRWVRNPMYMGMGIVLIGEGIVFPNLTWFMVVMVAVLWLMVTLFVIGYEEPTLRRLFGAEYEAYCREVRRWWPRLRPFDNSSIAAVQSQHLE